MGFSLTVEPVDQPSRPSWPSISLLDLFCASLLHLRHTDLGNSPNSLHIFDHSPRSTSNGGIFIGVLEFGYWRGPVSSSPRVKTRDCPSLLHPLAGSLFSDRLGFAKIMRSAQVPSYNWKPWLPLLVPRHSLTPAFSAAPFAKVVTLCIDRVWTKHGLP
jgi:hypothetical protein